MQSLTLKAGGPNTNQNRSNTDALYAGQNIMTSAKRQNVGGLVMNDLKHGKKYIQGGEARCG